MNRRAMLAIAPAAALSPLAVASGIPPSPPVAAQTPVERAYAQWEVLRDEANNPDMGDEEGYRRVDAMVAFEKRAETIPARGPQDVAKKIIMVTPYGEVGMCPKRAPTLWAEIFAMGAVL